MQFYTLDGPRLDANTILHENLKKAYKKDDLTQQDLCHEDWHESDVIKLCKVLDRTVVEILSSDLYYNYENKQNDFSDEFEEKEVISRIKENNI